MVYFHVIPIENSYVEKIKVNKNRSKNKSYVFTSSLLYTLFRCTKWTAHRTEMLQFTDTLRGNLSFYLGGKSPSDNAK